MQLTGKPIIGAGQAARMGIPTLNTDAAVPEDVSPGVYAAWAKLGEETYPAVCFIGTAYLIDGTPRRVEGHLLDTPPSRESMAQGEVTFELVEKIRDEQVFTSEEQAKDVIAEDIKNAKNVFEHHVYGNH